jgi:hypothetical protein
VNSVRRTGIQEGLLPMALDLLVANGTRRGHVRRANVVSVIAATLPTVAFMVLDVLSGLQAGVIAAAVAAGLICGWRFLRRESTWQAIVGLLFAGSCSLVAAMTGQARAFFLLPMTVPAAALVVCVASIAIGRPLTGVLGNRLVGGPAQWSRNDRLRRGYVHTTLVVAGVSVTSLIAQVVLYQTNQPGWLAVLHAAAAPMWVAVSVMVLVQARRSVASIR